MELSRVMREHRATIEAEAALPPFTERKPQTGGCRRWGCWPNRTTGNCNRCGNVAR